MVRLPTKKIEPQGDDTTRSTLHERALRAPWGSGHAGARAVAARETGSGGGAQPNSVLPFLTDRRNLCELLARHAFRALVADVVCGKKMLKRLKKFAAAPRPTEMTSNIFRSLTPKSATGH